MLQFEILGYILCHWNKQESRRQIMRFEQTLATNFRYLIFLGLRFCFSTKELFSSSLQNNRQQIQRHRKCTLKGCIDSTTCNTTKLITKRCQYGIQRYELKKLQNFNTNSLEYREKWVQLKCWTTHLQTCCMQWYLHAITGHWKWRVHTTLQNNLSKLLASYESKKKIPRLSSP